jgi:hypothetical protein
VCHQSVGLVARAIEEAGIPTISMTSAFDITFSVRPPRSVFLNFPLNHQTGKANDPELQRQILLDAFHALETIWAPGQIVTLPYVWDANDASWEEKDFGPGFELFGVGGSIQEGFGERRLKRSGGDAAR